MNIWLVNHYALPPGSSGGPTRHLGLARALRDRGHRVVLHASVFDHYARRDHRARGPGRFTVEDLDGVTYVWWATPPYHDVRGRIVNMLRFAADVARHALEAGVGRPDVVVGSSPHLLAPVAARRLARRSGVPFVLEVRDLWPESLVDLGELRRRHPAIVALSFVERRLYRTADRILVVPPFAADFVERRGAEPAKIVHVPNGVDMAIWPEPAPLPDREGFVAAYTGTLGLANGLEVVVDAARELARRGRSDIRLRLVGAGPERERLAGRASGIPADSLSIEPAVPSTEVPALLAEVDACLLVLRDSPVFRFGISPTKLFDYFAAGRPVVTSVRTPTDMVVSIGAGVHAEPGDPSSMADAIEQLASMPREERVEMGQRARRFVEERHSFEKLADRVEAVLLDVCRRGS